MLVMPLGVQAQETVIMQHPLATLTEQELEKAIRYLVPDDRQVSMRGSDKSLRSFLADYFTIQMMAEEARKKGLGQSERLAQVLANYENRLLAEALIEDHVASVKQPNFEQLAQEAYKAQPKLFVRPEQVSAEHILIAVNEERTDAEALKRAQQLYQELVKDKSRFAELAREYSDDKSVGQNSGKLGFFARDKMVPEFSATAFALQPGQLSQPVKTTFGYHLIHVLEHRAESQIPFEQVKARLIREQKEKLRLAKREEFVGTFRTSDKVVFDNDAMVRFVEKMQKSLEQ